MTISVKENPFTVTLQLPFYCDTRKAYNLPFIQTISKVETIPIGEVINLIKINIKDRLMGVVGWKVFGYEDAEIFLYNNEDLIDVGFLNALKQEYKNFYSLPINFGPNTNLILKVKNMGVSNNFYGVVYYVYW